MSYSEEKMNELVKLLEKHTPAEGINETSLPALGTFRAVKPQARTPLVYEPLIVILGQGQKYAYLDGQQYDYGVGNFLTLFLPLPLEVEIVAASVEKPTLMAGIKVDLNKIATMLLRLEQRNQAPTRSPSTAPSAIFTKPIDDELLDPVIRLFRTLDNPADQMMLSDAIVDEIYYRLICRDESGALQQLLQQRGQIQQISKAVYHIHNNLDEVVSVDELSSLVNMSTSGFHKRFKEVMHMSPLKYAKSIKLSRAQLLLREGKNASEAGYLVGYNSPAQFSREYKRHFGYAPSATAALI